MALCWSPTLTHAKQKTKGLSEYENDIGLKQVWVDLGDTWHVILHMRVVLSTFMSAPLPLKKATTASNV